jgi:hypothetical protein
MRSFYNRFLYRHHMRLIHHWGWHWFTKVGIAGPGSARPYVRAHRWCQWCGERKDGYQQNTVIP